MKKTILLIAVLMIALGSCSSDDDESDDKVDTGLAITVLERLQSETYWELEYGDEVFTPPL